MHILLTGATGLIGRALLDKLVARGDHVLAVSRTKQPSARGVTWVIGDPTDKQTYLESLDKAEAVINLAGAPIAKRWTPSHKRQVLRSRVETTQALVQALGEAPSRARTFLSASAVGYYGFDPHQPIQSEEAPLGAGFLAEVCRAWEGAAQEHLPDAVRLVILRLGVVLARGGGALTPMSRATRLGVGGAVGDGTQPFSWIHLDDAVNMFLFALDTPTVTGLLNCVAPAPTTQGQLFKALGHTLGRPVFLRAPRWAVRLVLGQLGEEALVGGQRASGDTARKSGFVWHFGGLEQALANLLKASTR